MALDTKLMDHALSPRSENVGNAEAMLRVLAVVDTHRPVSLLKLVTQFENTPAHRDRTQSIFDRARITRLRWRPRIMRRGTEVSCTECSSPELRSEPKSKMATAWTATILGEKVSERRRRKCWEFTTLEAEEQLNTCFSVYDLSIIAS